jgi:hypothetical protein
LIIGENQEDEHNELFKSMEDMKSKIVKNFDDFINLFEEEGIIINKRSKTVEISGVIIREQKVRSYPIEYVVVSEGGNTHEALILTKATPSYLNAALLSLGLEPGKTVAFKKIEPPPPQELIESGEQSPYEIIPPRGHITFIYVRYKKDGIINTKYLEDFLIDMRTGKPLERQGWIYIGSRFATVLQGKEKVTRYMADMERNIVASYLSGFGNAIFDINNIDGINDMLFDVNPDMSLCLGTKVTLIFSVTPL